MGLDARAREHVLLDEAVALVRVGGARRVEGAEGAEAVVLAAEAHPRQVAHAGTRCLRPDGFSVMLNLRNVAFDQRRLLSRSSVRSRLMWSTQV